MCRALPSDRGPPKKSNSNTVSAESDFRVRQLIKQVAAAFSPDQRCCGGCRYNNYYIIAVVTI